MLLLLMLVLGTVVTHVQADSDMELSPYQLEAMTREAPLVLYGKDETRPCILMPVCQPDDGCVRTDTEDCLICDHKVVNCSPKRRHMSLTVMSAPKDDGWIVPLDTTIIIGDQRNSTDEDVTKVNEDHNGEVYVFVTREVINGRTYYNWYEDLGFSAVHAGSDLSECGLMPNGIRDTPYTPCQYECPEGMFLYGDQCYFAKSSAANLTEAQTLCTADSGSVVSLNRGAFQYFKSWFGDDYFWINNSYTGGNDDKPECSQNELENWDQDSIQVGGTDHVIVVKEDGFCVVDSVPTEAHTVCHKAATTYIPRDYDNAADDEDAYMMTFETDSTEYGHCCKHRLKVEPKTLDVDFSDRATSSLDAAYLLGEFSYAHDEESVVILFEDSGNRGNKGGQMNPYIVYLSKVDDNGVSEVLLDYKPLRPDDIYTMSYNLYVIEGPFDRESQNLIDYTYTSCGNESRCFFHLAQYMAHLDGDLVTTIHFDVLPDLSTIGAMQRRDSYDILLRTADLCKSLFPDFKPYENGLVICPSPVAAASGMQARLVWVLLCGLIGLYFAKM